LIGLPAGSPHHHGSVVVDSRFPVRLQWDLSDEFGETDGFEDPIPVLSDRSQGLDPISRVRVVNGVDPLFIRNRNVSDSDLTVLLATIVLLRGNTPQQSGNGRFEVLFHEDSDMTGWSNGRR